MARNASVALGRMGSSTIVRTTPSSRRYSLTGGCIVSASTVQPSRFMPRRIGPAARASPSPGSSSTSAVPEPKRTLLPDNDGNDDFVGTGRAVAAHRRALRTIVVPQDPHAIENRQRIDENVPDRPEAQATADALKVHFDGSLGDDVAEVVNVGQHLEIERKAFHEDAGKHSIQNRALEQLDAGLRIAHRQTEERTHEHVVKETVDSPQPGILDLRLRMELRADDDVGFALMHYLEKARQLLWMQIHVGIQKCDVIAFRVVGAADQRVTFSFIAIATHDANVVGPRQQSVACGGMSAVHAAVVDDDDLKLDAQGVHRLDRFAHIFGYRSSLVVSGHEDREHGAAWLAFRERRAFSEKVNHNQLIVVRVRYAIGASRFSGGLTRLRSNFATIVCQARFSSSTPSIRATATKTVPPIAI